MNREQAESLCATLNRLELVPSHDQPEGDEDYESCSADTWYHLAVNHACSGYYVAWKCGKWYVEAQNGWSWDC